MSKTKAPPPNEIRIEGVGPIGPAREGINTFPEVLTIPLPPDGGLVVLSGDHGKGKSTALRCVSALAGGKQELSVNDNAATGHIEGLGVKVTIGKNQRRTGEAAFNILDGQSTVADLADPGILDPDARNRHRIKSLLSLGQARADISKFDHLIDPDDRAFILKPDTLKKDDLVSMAASVKRDLETAARAAEDQAENLEGTALAYSNQAQGIDVTVEADSGKLQAEVEAAIRSEQAIKSQERAFLDAVRRQDAAQESLEEAAGKYTGRSADDAIKAESVLILRQQETALGISAAVDAVQKAEQALAAARGADAIARTNLAAAIGARKAAESHEGSLAAWKQQIEASLPICPDEEEVTAATQRVQKAKDALEQGVLVRKAKEALAASQKALQKAKDARVKASNLREAAKSTDSILSEAVGKVSSRLKVGTGKTAGLLCVDTDRGLERFDELSEGERIREALLVAFKAVGPGGILVIPQGFFEQLSPATQMSIEAQLREARVTGLTAMVSDEPVLTARIAGQNGGAH